MKIQLWHGTSKLQSWHKKGRGDSIHPQPVMDLVVSKIKPDDEKSDKAVACQLYEARKITKHDILEEESFKKAIAAINPKMGIATLASNTPSEMVQTKYGNSPAGSRNSYQLSHSEANFPVYTDISTVARSPDSKANINTYPRFPLKTMNLALIQTLSLTRRECFYLHLRLMKMNLTKWK